MNILSILKEIDDFSDVPDEQLQWLIERAEVLHLKKDEHLFKPGDPIDKLLIVLEGNIVLKIQQGNQFRIAGSFPERSITGLLPYSRANHAAAYGITTAPTTMLRLPREHFREMIVHHEALTTALVHKMSTRIRQFTRFEQQNDKIMALGKLSAGLAHELNNPSAAIIRSARSLSKRIRLLQENLKDLLHSDLNNEQVDVLNAVLNKKLNNKPEPLTMLRRSEQEDELITWLEDHGLEDAEEVAEDLVDYGMTPDELEVVASHIDKKALAVAIRWVDQMLVSERLVCEIEDASKRINTLIGSVKEYTHMDQAPEKRPEDVHAGLESTLTMLNHKLKKADITVIREYQKDLEKPEIMISEMNQVWTNLIDNAIDAMEVAEKKELRLKTTQDEKYVYVIIGDTGTGIPEDIQEKIFDPFFTTKPIGKGTGLGMEVVQYIVTEQHNGSVSFETRPGNTEFKIGIPIHSTQ